MSDKKIIRLDGQMIVPDGLSHHEFLHKFYSLTKSEGWHFKGTTNVVDDTIPFERMKKVD